MAPFCPPRFIPIKLILVLISKYGFGAELSLMLKSKHQVFQGLCPWHCSRGQWGHPLLLANLHSWNIREYQRGPLHSCSQCTGRPLGKRDDCHPWVQEELNRIGARLQLARCPTFEYVGFIVFLPPLNMWFLFFLPPWTCGFLFCFATLNMWFFYMFICHL